MYVCMYAPLTSDIVNARLIDYIVVCMRMLHDSAFLLSVIIRVHYTCIKLESLMHADC